MTKHSPLPGQAAPASPALGDCPGLDTTPWTKPNWTAFATARTGSARSPSAALAYTGSLAKSLQRSARAPLLPQGSAEQLPFVVFPHASPGTPWLATAPPPPRPGHVRTPQHQVLISQGRPRKGSTPCNLEPAARQTILAEPPSPCVTSDPSQILSSLSFLLSKGHILSKGPPFLVLSHPLPLAITLHFATL